MLTHIHPLEPLSAGEVRQAVAILQNSGHVNSTTRFVSVSLKEPPKACIYGTNLTDQIDRNAFAVLFDNATNACHEAVVSLKENRLVSWKHIPGVQPTMTADEQVECEQAVLASPEFKAALKRQFGTDDTSLVMVDIWSAGNYGAPEESTRRMARPLCFMRADPTDNGYARPIEGIRPVVDLNEMRVIRVEEYGHWPLPPLPGNYASSRVPEKRPGIKPLEITQPEGPSFQVEGRVVRWQNWSLVVGFNAREGLTLHDIRYNDGGKERSILYRASLTEMVVPYGDPSATQFRKNAFDVGEYGMGMCANSLELGCDCLGLIHYFDADLTTSRGEPLTIKNAICMHEEDYGILWKHTDRRLPETPEVRRSRRLVISSVSTVENYEYGFFWHLYQDGNIQLELKLTGILSLGTLQPGETSKYGAMIAPQLYAPVHQHFFNVRLDFAVDGTNNSGSPVGYKFMPMDNSFPMAQPSAWWRKRAGFVDYHVWVTPFDETEQFAAGDYPNQSQGGDGLTKWTEQDRPIENTDLVFWYTFGHTHIPRPEDYPVMPTAYIGFLLKPNGFFTMNPANDVPPSPGKAPKGGCCH